MSALTPIIGITPLNVGSISTFTDSTVGGTWSSSDTAIATVSRAGVVTAIAAGSCQIIYTVGSDSTAFQLTVENHAIITNGMNYNDVYNSLKDRILWQSQGLTSQSGRYYEDGHPLCNTQILEAIRPKNGETLTQYLANKQRSVIFEVLNAIQTEAQLIDKARLIFQRPDVMLYPQPVANVGQFVGIKMLISPDYDISVKFDSVELFFDSDVTFPLYLYNDMTLPPLYVKTVTAKAYEQVIVDLSNDVIQSYLTPLANKGGIRYFGYYQNDLGRAKALYYSIYNPIFHGGWLWAFSAPLWTDAPVQPNFQRNNIGSNNLTYGLNIEISIFKNLTNTIYQSSHLFDEAIMLYMAVKVVNDIVFNYQTNAVQRAIGSTPVEDLMKELNGYIPEGSQPRIMGLRDKMDRAMKTLKAGFQPAKTRKPSVGISNGNFN